MIEAQVRTGTVVFCGVPPFGRQHVLDRWSLDDLAPPIFVDPDRLDTHAPSALVIFEGAVNTVPLDQLRFVQLLSAGSDHVDLERFERAGVVVTSHGDVNASAVAEHTLMLMLALLRRLEAQSASLRRGSWRDGAPPFELRSLAGRRVGVLGLGNIGTRVADLAHAFGAIVGYHDIEPMRSSHRALGLAELLAWSELLTIHTPLTPQTRGLVDAAAIEALPPGAFLVNAARGGIVDEDALFDALRRGRLAGAALDVFASEPPRPERLVDVPNLLVTPHRAGSTRENWRARLDVALDNLARWFAREPLRHRLV